jgi:hypothetical protein
MTDDHAGGRHEINLSTAWLPPDPASGRPAWLRRFGRPTGIEPGDRVWLVIESAVDGEATLGGEPLPPVAAGTIRRHDVTAMLGQRNELWLTPSVTADIRAVVAGPGRCELPATIARVSLEIEPMPGLRQPA